MKTVIVASCAIAALALTACSKRDSEPTPAGSEVAGAMPDTNAPRTPNRTLTAPDAGATGAAEPLGGNNVSGVAGATVPNPQASGNSQ